MTNAYMWIPIPCINYIQVYHIFFNLNICTDINTITFDSCTLQSTALISPLIMSDTLVDETLDKSIVMYV